MAALSPDRLRDLTDLQLSILDVLWSRGEATANTVHGELQGTIGLARGTIGTLLHRLERQRVVTHRADGREFFYRPTVTREQVMAARVEGLVGLFGGDLAAMVSFAVSGSEIGQGDLDRIRSLIDEQSRAAAATRPVDRPGSRRRDRAGSPGRR